MPIARFTNSSQLFFMALVFFQCSIFFPLHIYYNIGLLFQEIYYSRFSNFRYLLLESYYSDSKMNDYKEIAEKYVFGTIQVFLYILLTLNFFPAKIFLKKLRVIFDMNSRLVECILKRNDSLLYRYHRQTHPAFYIQLNKQLIPQGINGTGIQSHLLGNLFIRKVRTG